MDEHENPDYRSTEDAERQQVDEENKDVPTLNDTLVEEAEKKAEADLDAHQER